MSLAIRIGPSRGALSSSHASGVTAMRRFATGMPSSSLTSSTVRTRFFATDCSLRAMRRSIADRSLSAHSLKLMPSVTVRMSKWSSATVDSVSRTSSNW
jgi:hypothetical protein